MADKHDALVVVDNSHATGIWTTSSRKKPWNSVNYRSHAAHFAAHPGDLEELIGLGQEAPQPARRGD